MNEWMNECPNKKDVVTGSSLWGLVAWSSSSPHHCEQIGAIWVQAVFSNTTDQERQSGVHPPWWLPSIQIRIGRLVGCKCCIALALNHISHIVIFAGVFQASAEDETVCPKLSWFRQLCCHQYLIDTLLVLLRHTCTVLFCVCKVSLQSSDIMPPKSLLFIIIIIITQLPYIWPS